MRKLVESTFVTLGGVIGEPQLWAQPYWDKDADGGDLLKFGTGEVDAPLLTNSLIDELHLWVFPVIAGDGDRLAEGIDTTHLKLLDTSRFESGIVVHVLGAKDRRGPGRTGLWRAKRD